MVQYMDNNSGFNQWNAMRPKQSKKFGFIWWVIFGVFAWWIMGAWFQPQTTVIETNNNNSIMEKSVVAVNKIDADKISADVQGLRISNVALKEHYKNADKKELISLFDGENNFIEIGFVSTNTQAPNINTKWNIRGNEMNWNNKSGIKFTRKINIDNYVIKISDVVKNNSSREISLAPYVRMIRNNDEKSASSAVETGGVVYANSSLNYENWNKLNKKSVAYSTVRGSFGFADQYWETIASISANDQTISLKKSGDLYVADANASDLKIIPGQEIVFDTFVFTGPRMADVLNAASANIPGINKTMDYGWFWFFAQPMLWMINWLFALVGNYGIAIILMTLILRLFIWPLTRKSYVSTMAMQKMQPELQRVQKLYANDKARLQMEMMKIYQSHKTSPMSGCLPMLIQIPIFFALYKALLISVPMRSAHFLWISDLAAMDPYFILPIIMGLTMWLQQYWQTPKNQNTSGKDAVASTQRVMKWMPIIFTLMFAWMPSGLVLYWTVSNIFGIIQMYMIKKTVK